MLPRNRLANDFGEVRTVSEHFLTMVSMFTVIPQGYYTANH